MLLRKFRRWESKRSKGWMLLAEKGVRGKGRQPLSPPQYCIGLERDCVVF